MKKKMLSFYTTPKGKPYIGVLEGSVFYPVVYFRKAKGVDQKEFDQIIEYLKGS